MTRAHARVLTAAVAALLGAACSGNGAGPEGTFVDEREARARWEAAGLDDYAITVGRSCFCDRASVGRAVVTVRDGAVTSAVWVDSGEPVPERFRDLFPGVDGLFALLADARAEGAEDIVVTFDPRFGSPTEIRLDFIVAAVDDEIFYEATRPVPLD